MTEVVIASAARTAVGNFNGTLAGVPAHELGSIAIKGALERAGVAPEEVDDVLMGQILTAGQGQNTARQAAMGAGIPDSSSAMTINQVCGSGLRTVAMAYQAIKAGDANIMVAGGQENMSSAQHAVLMRPGVKMGPAKMQDTMIFDALTCAFNGYHMGNTAENIARKWQFTREEQDAFAVGSQNKAEAARNAGKFKDEIVPVTIKTRKAEIVFEQDEFIRDGVTAADLGKLRAAFDKEGTVTAGNASGINDGAGATVVMSAAEAEKRGLETMGRIVGWATAGVDPAIMGTGPIPATQKLLEKIGWSVNDLDIVEANEAFAAQAMSVVKDLGLNPDIVNVNGGAIAIGHPVGASGNRILNTLLFEMKRQDLKKGLATLCIGGGMGISLAVERD